MTLQITNADWDQRILANPDGGHFLQSQNWGEFKAHWGWQPRQFVHQLPEGEVAAQYLVRKIPFLGSIWYAPKGPGVGSVGQLVSILKEAATEASDAFMIKVEPEVAAGDDNAAWLRAAGLVKAPSDLQFKSTIFVDLRPDEEQILASFKQKTRYNVRLAMRKGVVVEPVPATADNMVAMYKLFCAAQERAGFFLRQQRYFEGYWKLLAEAGQGQLFFARYNEELLAGAFVIYMGDKAWYKDGGSFTVKRELMAPYLLQWEIMRWLKARGGASYDLVAVPPADQLNDKHPFWGLYRFKSGFNSEITEFIGAWDFPLRSWQYRLWRSGGERLAFELVKAWQHDLLY